jgi:hypothetical protein
MATRGTVKFDGISGPSAIRKGEFDIMKVSYTVRQETDITGRISSKVIGGTATIQIASAGGPDFFNWKADPTKMIASVIISYLAANDDSKVVKTVTFKDVYCISYTEGLEAFGNNPVNETMVITANTVDEGGIVHNNFWPDVS